MKSVTEESIEEESDFISRKPPMNFINFNKKLTNSKFVNLEQRINNLPKTKLSGNFTSHSLVNMDPVYEVKEESDLKNESIKVISSPRVKYLTGFSEDMVSSRGYYNTSFINSTNKYDFEANDIITEDNAENNVDNDLNLKKLIAHHLKLEDFIDKSDTIEEVIGSCNINTDDFECIKEENQDDEEIQHKINNDFNVPLSDSFELERVKQPKISIINPESIIGEAIFEEKDEE